MKMGGWSSESLAEGILRLRKLMGEVANEFSEAAKEEGSDIYALYLLFANYPVEGKDIAGLIKIILNVFPEDFGNWEVNNQDVFRRVADRLDECFLISFVPDGNTLIKFFDELEAIGLFRVKDYEFLRFLVQKICESDFYHGDRVPPLFLDESEVNSLIEGVAAEVGYVEETPTPIDGMQSFVGHLDTSPGVVELRRGEGDSPLQTRRMRTLSVQEVAPFLPEEECYRIEAFEKVIEGMGISIFGCPEELCEILAMRVFYELIELREMMVNISDSEQFDSYAEYLLEGFRKKSFSIGKGVQLAKGGHCICKVSIPCGEGDFVKELGYRIQFEVSSSGIRFLMTLEGR